jgi:ribonuclease HI
VEIPDPDKLWTYVACDEGDCTPCEHGVCRAPHEDCIVIAVDGACKNNGTPLAQAAIGVFVGVDSKYNESRLLTEPTVTNQIAELEAGILGLEQAIQIQKNRFYDRQIEQVVIKADSKYLVEGMTDWIFKWEKNGYQTAKRSPVVNRALFEKLQKLVEDLNGIGVKVLFWHVPRKFNKKADEWANRLLIA